MAVAHGAVGDRLGSPSRPMTNCHLSLANRTEWHRDLVVVLAYNDDILAFQDLGRIHREFLLPHVCYRD
jgi:hypothetical protein